MERRQAAKIGRNRARAMIGDLVLFDMTFGLPGRSGKEVQGEAIDVQFGGDGEVRVPFDSNLKVYAGRSAEVRSINGRVTATTGLNLTLRGVHVLVHAASGGSMDLDCDSLEGNELKFGAGQNLRFYIRDLSNARLVISDLGGYWEAVLGDGQSANRTIRLEAGGDVTIVTDREVVPQPPNYTLGMIEKPQPSQ